MDISTNYQTKIMGVINANEDSFFKESRFEGAFAISRIEQMINDGANIIDIGGVSSRPGSVSVSSDEELFRVKPIIDSIYEQRLYDKTEFSLDSYDPFVLKYALDRGFKIVNDITGLSNDEVCKIASYYNAKVVIMHMQNNPNNMQKKPEYNDVVLDIDNFFKERIKKAKSFGLEEIILDVGIGFGKTLTHNLKLLKNLDYFKHFGCELLIGASRKSMIDMISPSSIEERLPGTLAIHLASIENGASIIRCHDVKEHNQAIKVQEAIKRAEIL
ncbi:dihydropteroate synthase [Arcobacter sp. LA11]|uniref:dihydropteroate synthase n=1 Tax=Arcobacter sp. LA11 TaxID=1898176 RepID=UPI000932ED78|nr:dihydropteroate synthase [Arcobacter sp. LA11]